MCETVGDSTPTVVYKCNNFRNKCYVLWPYLCIDS